MSLQRSEFKNAANTEMLNLHYRIALRHKTLLNRGTKTAEFFYNFTGLNKTVIDNCLKREGLKFWFNVVTVNKIAKFHGLTFEEFISEI